MIAASAPVVWELRPRHTGVEGGKSPEHAKQEHNRELASGRIVEMKEPDYARKRRYSRPVVEFPGSTARDVLRVATAILGRRVKPGDLADLTGAPDEAVVQVVNPIETILALTADAPGYQFTGRLIRQPDEALELHIDDVFVPDRFQREGVGTQAMSRLVGTARRLGFQRIQLLAMRGGSYIGYKVWPKLGFDAQLKLTAKQRATLPERLRSTTRLSDLYEDPTGIAWWEKNGFSLPMEFALTPGSRSLLVWTAYRKRKKK